MPKAPELPGMPAERTPTRLDDLRNLFPEGVMPTGQIHVLEQGDNILLLKTYEWFREPTPKQRQIWKLLARYGNHPDAPGTITVLCVWGLGHKTRRKAVVFDHLGENETNVRDVTSLRDFIKAWWVQSRKGRR